MMEFTTKIIAHRGFHKGEKPTVENSLEAFRLAQELPIYGSELDIRLTKDNELIVFHDDYFQNWKISKSSSSFLQKLQLDNGENLPRLEDFLQQGKKYPYFRLIIELKPPANNSLKKIMVEKTLFKISLFQMEHQVMIISFSIHICELVKKILPSIEVQYLKGNLSPKQISDKGINGINYHYSIFLENLNWISEAKKMGLSTNSWTVNDEEIFNQFCTLGIDYLTTDYPNKFIKKL